jgi:hypothetical protein
VIAVKLDCAFYNRIAIAVLTLALGVYYASSAETPASEINAGNGMLVASSDDIGTLCKEEGFADSIPVSHEIPVVCASSQTFFPSPDSDTIKHWSILIAPRPERGPPSAA